jgi:hypothetical protein
VEGMDKSILVTAPGRCGMHWVSYVLCDLLGLEKYRKTKRWENHDVLELEQGIEPGGRLHLTHDPIEFCKPAVGLVDIVAVVRDPRDIIVSSAHYWVSDLHGGNKDAIRKAWDLDIPNETDFETALMGLKRTGHNTRWFHSYMETYKQIPSFIVRYEDFSLTPGLVLNKFLQYTERPPFDDNAIRQAIYGERFYRRTKGRHPGEEDVAHFRRKGVVGDWVNYFTDDENQEFCRKFGEIMDFFGYNEEGTVYDWGVMC